LIRGSYFHFSYISYHEYPFGIPRTALDVFNTLPEGTLCEVIDNALYFPPARTTTHQRVLGDILVEIYEVACQLGDILMAPCDVYLDGGQAIVQPDIFFIKADRCHIVEKRGIMGRPDLIIEILLSNESFDKEMKFNLYQRNSIPEYFIIEPETKSVLHYLLVNSVYQLQESKPAGQLYIKQLDLRVNF
jgi:Uma2 family endonuclease